MRVNQCVRQDSMIDINVCFFLSFSSFLYVSCKCLHPRLDRTKRTHTHTYTLISVYFNGTQYVTITDHNQAPTPEQFFYMFVTNGKNIIFSCKTRLDDRYKCLFLSLVLFVSLCELQMSPPSFGQNKTHAHTHVHTHCGSSGVILFSLSLSLFYFSTNRAIQLT